MNTVDKSRRACCITVDLDPIRCYCDIHGLPRQKVPKKGDPTYRLGVKRFLSLAERFDIEGTLFAIGRDLAHPPHIAALREASDAGHEIGNHTQNHLYDLRNQTIGKQRREIARAHKTIASRVGIAPKGFRTPGYNVSESLLQICRSLDYEYDSSILASPSYYTAKAVAMAWKWLGGHPSRSSMTKIGQWVAPKTPYWPEPGNIWRESDGGSNLVFEVPMAVVPFIRIPFIGTFFQMMGKSGFDRLYPSVRRNYPRLLQIEFHAIDFLGAEDLDNSQLANYQPDLKTPWHEKKKLYEHIFEILTRDYTMMPLERAVRWW